MDAQDFKRAATYVTHSRGKFRAKEYLVIASIISAFAAFSFRVDINVEQDRVKNVSVLVGEFAKLKQECEK
jgi:hypothetical protein